MRAQIALFVCTIAYISLAVRALEVWGDWQWARKHGTTLQRAITRFDVMRLSAAGMGIIGVGLHFVGRLTIISDVLILASVAMLPIAVVHLRVARRQALEQEQRAKIAPKPVTLRLVESHNPAAGAEALS